MTDARLVRIIDVNLNRLTEGLRVVEDVVRFGLENRTLLAGVRKLRTQVGRDMRALRRQVIAGRKSETDPGRGDRFDRAKRKSLEDVLLANFKRAEEAARVLEEVLKVAEPQLAGKLKAVRFRLYDLEKMAVDEVRSQKAECGGRPKSEGRRQSAEGRMTGKARCRMLGACTGELRSGLGVLGGLGGSPTHLRPGGLTWGR